MPAGKRAVRVGDQILREISLILLEKVGDPRVSGVTITGISLTNDLKLARVYFSLIGEKDKVVSAQAGLDSAKGFIKKEIGLRLPLRYIPEISFIHDPSLENGSNMDRLLNELKSEESNDVYE